MHGFYPHEYVEENFLAKKEVYLKFYNKDEVEILLQKFSERVVEWTIDCLNEADKRNQDEVLQQFIKESFK